jgi:hypothetical protein
MWGVQGGYERVMAILLSIHCCGDMKLNKNHEIFLVLHGGNKWIVIFQVTTSSSLVQDYIVS